MDSKGAKDDDEDSGKESPSGKRDAQEKQAEDQGKDRKLGRRKRGDGNDAKSGGGWMDLSSSPIKTSQKVKLEEDDVKEEAITTK